jgi:hypothetical protein
MALTKFEKAALRFVKYNEAAKDYYEYLQYMNFDDGPEYTSEQQEAITKKRWEHYDDLKSEAEAGYDEMVKYLEKHKARQHELLNEITRITEEAGAYD